MPSQGVAQRGSDAATARTAGILLLLAIVSALFYYKWGSSLRVLANVSESGRLAVSPRALVDGGVLATTGFYFGKIWPALTYGLLIGAAVRTSVPPRLVSRWLGGNGTQPTVAGALVGAPLMLCSCCVTPIFSGLYLRGARLGPALAVMLASPGLNLAALVLTFTLLPVKLAALRVAAALVIVIGIPQLINRWVEPRQKHVPDVCDVPSSQKSDGNEDAERTLPALLLGFAKILAYMIAITVPLVLIGVTLSGFVMPFVATLSSGGLVVTIGLVALLGTLVALPTFFEIPIALMLLAAGAPLGVAVAFVIAGPIVNLGSLFVLARETRPQVSLSLAASVWLVSTLAGLASAL